MQKMKYWLAVWGVASAWTVHAQTPTATFQCQMAEGESFFTSRPMAGCEAISFSQAQDMQADDYIGPIWYVPSQRIDNDVVLKRPPAIVPMTIQLRNQPKVVQQPKVAMTIPKYQAPPPPISSEARQKQVLQKEIGQEKSALARDEAALAAARSGNKQTLIPRLERNVKERRANLQALQSEYQRLR